MFSPIGPLCRRLRARPNRGVKVRNILKVLKNVCPGLYEAEGAQIAEGILERQKAVKEFKNLLAGFDA